MSEETGATGGAPPPAPGRDPRAAMLLVPVLFGVGMIGAAAAWLLTVMNTSGSAAGETVDVRFSSDCAAEAISARLEGYGLPGAWNGSTLRLTLAGTPGDSEVPAALAAPGRLVVTVEGVPREVAVERGGVQISLTGVAVSLFTLDAELPERGLAVTLDGVEQAVESVNSRELMLAATGADSTAVLRIAADRVMQVLHPLPCAVQVLDVSPVAAAVL